MKPWFEAQPSVFEEEKSVLEALGFVVDEKALRDGKTVVFHGASRVGPKRKLRVVFPSGYPSFPPEIFDDSSEPLLTRHHHPQNRGFCLFGPDRVRWISRKKADEAVAEAESLIREYAPGSVPPLIGEVPEPVSDLLAVSELGGVLLPPNIAAELAKPVRALTISECQLAVTSDAKAARRAIVLSLHVGNDKLSAQNFQRFLAGQATEARNAVVVRFERSPSMINGASGPDAWLKDVPAHLRKGGKARDEWFLFVYPEEAREATSTGIGLTAMHVTRDRWQCYRCFPLSTETSFSRIPGLEPLAGKKVIIVGVGALGSRIGVCLAASGVGRFFLIDHDVYDPANAVRHECGFPFFGVPKVRAVTQRLIEMNPHCHVSAMAGRIGSMSLPDEEALAKWIAEADLVVNATGSEHTAHWLDRYCQSVRKNCLHAAVANGAWSGEVIRALPGVTPCWVCHQIANEPLTAEPRPAGGFFAPGCAHPTFTGSMPEVAIVAELASAMAIETLLERSVRDFFGSHIRWTARSSAGAWAPGIEVLTPRARPECSVCAPNLKPSVISS